jgi:hypothetical protein
VASLEFTSNDSTFVNNGWTVAPVNAAVTLCAGVQLFGGYNAYGNGATITKTF